MPRRWLMFTFVRARSKPASYRRLSPPVGQAAQRPVRRRRPTSTNTTAHACGLRTFSGAEDKPVDWIPNALGAPRVSGLDLVYGSAGGDKRAD